MLSRDFFKAAHLWPWKYKYSLFLSFFSSTLALGHSSSLTCADPQVRVRVRIALPDSPARWRSCTDLAPSNFIAFYWVNYYNVNKWIEPFHRWQLKTEVPPKEVWLIFILNPTHKSPWWIHIFIVSASSNMKMKHKCFLVKLKFWFVSKIQMTTETSAWNITHLKKV